MPGDTLTAPSNEEAAHNDLHSLIVQRRTRRAFSTRHVERGTLRTLLEAARWAPSSMNEQPWNFIVAWRKNPAEFERLLCCLMDFNVPWAQHAPVLMLVLARLNFSSNGAPNCHALYDVGQAVAALTYQAMACGLNVCQMAGFEVEKARSIFSIPADHEPVVVMAVGYPGDPAIQPEKIRKKEMVPRVRHALDKFVFEGKWGQPAEWRSSPSQK